MSRLCSADLAPVSAFYDAESRLGYTGRMFLNGEEVSPDQEGRAFAHLMNGTSYELPALGKASWENLLARPDSGRQTVVIGLDDSSGPVARTGLPLSWREDGVGPSRRSCGALGRRSSSAFRSRASRRKQRPRQSPDDTPFTLYPFGNVTSVSGCCHRIGERGQRRDGLPAAGRRGLGSLESERLLLRHDRDVQRTEPAVAPALWGCHAARARRHDCDGPRRDRRASHDGQHRDRSSGADPHPGRSGRQRLSGHGLAVHDRIGHSGGGGAA